MYIKTSIKTEKQSLPWRPSQSRLPPINTPVARNVAELAKVLWFRQDLWDTPFQRGSCVG